jgi:hypothetical protein
MSGWTSVSTIICLVFSSLAVAAFFLLLDDYLDD